MRLVLLLSGCSKNMPNPVGGSKFSPETAAVSHGLAIFADMKIVDIGGRIPNNYLVETDRGWRTAGAGENERE